MSRRNFIRDRLLSCCCRCLLKESIFDDEASHDFWTVRTLSGLDPRTTPRKQPQDSQKLSRVQVGTEAEAGKRMEWCYTVGKELGSGAFSTVCHVKHRASGQSYAMKCVTRSKLSKADDNALHDEVAILKEFNHVHIIKLYDFFIEPDTYYLILEEMSGGELFDRISKKSFYNEKEARDLCQFLLEAMKYCHDRRVAHRDLKPENLLLQNKTDDSNIKIADFGFAKRVMIPKSLTTQCGTPNYVAPEILKGLKYDEKVDMWSVGVILFILLGGYPPFVGHDQARLFSKIRSGSFEFKVEFWGDVSEEAKNLISSLLVVNPDNRISASQALENVWITEQPEALEGKDLTGSLAEFKKFNAKRKLKGSVHTVIIANRMKRMSMTAINNQTPNTINEHGEFSDVI